MGAFLFTKYADIYGRKKVVCFAAIFTPISLAALLLFAQKFELFFIYIVFGILGLTYNPRGSTVYLYSAELLPKDKRLLFGSLLFFIDGMFSVSASYYFYEFKSQNAFFLFIIVGFTTAWILMIVFLPETPSFLLMKGDIKGYRLSLAKVTG